LFHREERGGRMRPASPPAAREAGAGRQANKNLFTIGPPCGSVDASEVLRPVKGGTELDIMVTPNAKKAQVGEVDVWRKRLVIKVTALPTEGRANEAVVELLSARFGARVEILRGHTDRHKTVLVPLPIEEARSRLVGP
jgi:uncharacterized protein (TIGR00251 family)